MRTRILIALATALIVAAGTHFVRGYPWELAAISGLLLGGLMFVTLQTLTRLRSTLAQFGRRD